MNFEFNFISVDYWTCPAQCSYVTNTVVANKVDLKISSCSY